MASDSKSDTGDKKGRANVAKIAAGSVVGFAAGGAFFRNSDSVTKLLDSLSKLSQAQAGLLVSLILFGVLLWLVVHLVHDAVRRREEEVQSFREIASKWEAIINGELKEVKTILKKGGR